MSTTRSLRILYVEDDPGAGILMKRKLKRAGYTVDVATDGQQGLSMFESGAYDVLFVDHDVPKLTGLEFVRAVASKGKLPPTVMITGAGNEQIAVEAMKLGASDYVVKDGESRYHELMPTVIQRALDKELLVRKKNCAEQRLRKSKEELSRRVLQRTADLVDANNYLRMEVVERELIEKALRESEMKYRGLIESLPQTVAIFQDSRLVFMNSTGLKMFGWSSVDEAIGTHECDLVADVDIYRVSAITEDRRFGKAGVPDNYSAMLRRVDGSEFPAEIFVKPIDYCGKPAEQVVYSDLTQRMQAQEALYQSERRWRTLFEQSMDAILVVKPDGLIMEANCACCQLLGVAEEEVRGLSFSGLPHVTEGKPAFIKEIRNKGFSKEFPLTVVRQDGSQRDCLITASEWRDEEGILLGYLGIARDITESKRLQEQLFQSQKLEAIGTLAGGIAHDFNNLLQIIGCNVDLLLLDKAEEDAGYEECQGIRCATERGVELVRAILTFTKKVAARTQPVDLNERVGESCKLLSRTLPRTIQIELRLASDLGTISADPVQMQQMLLNLAVNSRDAMSRGGTIVFETNNIDIRDDTGLDLPECEPGEYVHLTVSDTGDGMEKTVLNRIFEPFFTTKESGKGTGLGLSLVFGIVKGHKGAIRCHSEPGKGTTFDIYLPAQAQPTEMSEPPGPEASSRGHETILFVDDEKLIRDGASKLLSWAGYTVLTADCGTKGLELFKKERDKISLVIVDLAMPGMDGLQFLKRLLEMDPKASVIVTSGFSSNEETSEAIRAGAKGFVNKPFKVGEMLQVVRSFLDRS